MASKWPETIARAKVGTVRCEISKLVFDDDCRDEQPNIIDYLMSTYEAVSCQREGIQGNYITALLLEPFKAMVSIRARNNTGEIPLLPSRCKISCLHGRQRTAAAKRFFQDEHDKWWPLELYYFETEEERARFRLQHAISENCRGPFCGGYILRKIYRHEAAGEAELARACHFHLRPAARHAVMAIDKHKSIRDILQKFGDSFPVLIDQLNPAGLRNIRYCDEMWERGLRRIYKVYDHLTLQQASIRRAFTRETAALIHSRAPVVCDEDHHHITLQMKNGLLFPAIKSRRLRDKILKRTLQYPMVFQSVDSFIENTRKFQDAIKVVREVLLPKLPYITAGREPPTIWDEMGKFWEPPSESTMIEIREGVFQKTTEVGVRLACQQIIISILRQIDRLLARDAGYQLLLLKRAHVLGFSTPKITDGLAGHQDEAVKLAPMDMVDKSKQLKAVGMNAEQRRQLFLPTLVQLSRRHLTTKDDLTQLTFIEDFIALDEACYAAVDGLEGQVVYLVDEGHEEPSSAAQQRPTEREQGTSRPQMTREPKKTEPKRLFRQPESTGLPDRRRQPRFAPSSRRSRLPVPPGISRRRSIRQAAAARRRSIPSQTAAPGRRPRNKWAIEKPRRRAPFVRQRNLPSTAVREHTRKQPLLKVIHEKGERQISFTALDSPSLQGRDWVVFARNGTDVKIGELPLAQLAREWHPDCNFTLVERRYLDKNPDLRDRLDAETEPAT